MSEDLRERLPFEPQAPARASSPAARRALGTGRIKASLLAGVPVPVGYQLGRDAGRLEAEAEHAADRIIRMPDAAAPKSAAHGRGDTGASRVAASGAGGGRALATGERAYFESRFGHSFAHVRIHTGERAATAAHLFAAQAFTRGPDIAFGRNQYRPGSASGRLLLAHELAHVIQQGSAPPLSDAGTRAMPDLSVARGGGFVQQRPLAPATVAGLDVGPLQIMPAALVDPGDEPPEALTLRLFPPGQPYPVTATSEAVPADSQAGVFAGFTALHDAQSFAVHQPAITLIVSDPDPLFHVLSVSGVPATSNPVTSRRLNPQLGHGLTSRRAVNPHLRGPATRRRGWPAREVDARALREQYVAGPRAGDSALWTQLRRAYTELAVDACGATPDQIYVLQNAHDPQRPGKININLFSARSSVGSGLSGPGRLFPGTEPSRQQQWFHINWQRFQQGEAAVRSTYRHEAIHAGGRERVLALIARWQAIGRPLGSLSTWLNLQRQMSEGGGMRVTDRDVLLARAYTLGGRSDEPFTAAMTFMTVYHRTPAEGIDPLTTFSQLNYMLHTWSRMASMPDLRQHILDILRRYYREQLDVVHRAAFNAWVDEHTVPAAGEGREDLAEALRQMRAFRNGV